MAVDGTECGPPHRPPRPASAAAAGRAFRRAFAGWAGVRRVRAPSFRAIAARLGLGDDQIAMSRVQLAALVVIAAAAAGCGSGESSKRSVPARAPHPAALRITRLSGSVAKLGSLDGFPLLGVRLRAIVCVSSPEAAYPSAIGVTHYAVYKRRREWWPARSVVDRTPWLVPLGETWHGKPCGPVRVEDPLPPGHYGVESLGNPNTCYGVRLTITVGKRRASRRAIIRCGGLPPARPS